MVGDLGCGQEEAEQVLDLPQAQAHGESGGGQLVLRGLVAPDRAFGGPLEFGDRPAQALVLGLKFGHGFGGGFGGETTLDLAGMLVDGLSAALGLFGLPSHVAVLTREDSGGVEDPGTNR